jgi:two-component system, OmpR family, KDP operon response regulator KdpE
MNDAETSVPVKVLVIDDEVQIRRLLATALESNGYRVIQAGDGSEGLTLAARHQPEMIILDLGLPDMEGIAFLKQVREWTQVPVVVLSVQNGATDKITALDSGADDYVTKPFNTGELLARLRAALRHADRPKAGYPIFQSGDLIVDLTARRITRRGEPVKLTVTEFSLLRLFIQHAGKVLTHRQILREVWGPNYEAHNQYLRVYITYLRNKLEENPRKPRLLLTESGVGYRLSENVENHKPVSLFAKVPQEEEKQQNP